MSLTAEPKQVWYILSQIPEGKVVTYGQLAEMIGFEKGARVVGNILKQLPAGSDLPWHRVINSKGEISFPKGTHRYLKQVERLEKEGISFIKEKISLQHYRWHGD